MIILISGKQGSGKTTLSKKLRLRILEDSPINAVTELKFAGPLYTLHKIIYEYMGKRGVTPPNGKDGDLLQLLGTEWGRNKFGKDVWVDMLKKEASEVLSYGLSHNPWQKQFIIIDDCRFENEFDAFPDSLSIRLECKEEVRKARASYWRENHSHLSETGLDSYSALGKFSLVIDSGVIGEEEIIELVMRHLRGKIEAHR